MRNSVPPLSIRQQFGFVWRLLPLVGLALAALLFRVWKVLEMDQLRNQVFRATRTCASFEGELQIEQGTYLSRTAFGRIERAGREQGLVWPDSSLGLIVADPRLAERDPSLEWQNRGREEGP